MRPNPVVSGASLRPIRLIACIACLLIFASAQQPAQQSGAVPAPVLHNAEGKLPQDSGKLGLENMLRKLHNTGRLIQFTAHPDDEDSGMLVYESRAKGVD